MLAVTGLTVRFGDVAAVDDAALEVPSGSIVAVMGPSGCGKTTLLRAIAGLEPVASGTISWDGEEVGDVPVHRRDFGLMFQDYALFPHRSVAGNVAFGLRMQKLPPAALRSRVDEMLALVGLEGLDARSVGTLSGGQQQRVALARTLAPSPRLVLLDEPLGSLDRALRDQLVGEMRAIFGALHTTAVYVTHDRDEAFAIADRVAVMMAGRIERTGRPDELWADPGTTATARFLGMENIVPAGDVAAWAPTPAGADHVVIRPDALEISPDGGAVPARVVASRFQAGSYRVLVQPARGPALVAVSTRHLAMGITVGLSVAPEGVIALG